MLPVKRFDDAKQRLDKTFNAGTRRALAEAMVSDVLHALRRAERIDKVVVVTGESGAEALARAYDGLLDGMVADEPVEGLPHLVTDTLMTDAAARRRVAEETLRFAEGLGRSFS